MKYNQNRIKPVFEFVPFDPEYTIDTKRMLQLTGLNNTSFRVLQRAGKFPMPKRFAHSHVCYHPDHIEAWLRCRALGLDWSAIAVDLVPGVRS